MISFAKHRVLFGLLWALATLCAFELGHPSAADAGPEDELFAHDAHARLGIEIELYPEKFAKLISYFDLRPLQQEINGDEDLRNDLVFAWKKSRLNQSAKQRLLKLAQIPATLNATFNRLPIDERMTYVPLSKIPPDDLAPLLLSAGFDLDPRQLPLRANVPADSWIRGLNYERDQGAMEFKSGDDQLGTRKPYQAMRRLAREAGVENELFNFRATGNGLYQGHRIRATLHFHIGFDEKSGLSDDEVRRRLRKLNSLFLFEELALTDHDTAPLTSELTGYMSEIEERGIVRSSGFWERHFEVRRHFKNPVDMMNEAINWMRMGDDFDEKILRRRIELLTKKPSILARVAKHAPAAIIIDTPELLAVRGDSLVRELLAGGNPGAEKLMLESPAFSAALTRVDPVKYPMDVQPILARAKSESVATRRAAIAALSDRHIVNIPDAQVALVLALRDPDAPVREAAQKALRSAKIVDDRVFVGLVQGFRNPLTGEIAEHLISANVDAFLKGSVWQSEMPYNFYDEVAAERAARILAESGTRDPRVHRMLAMCLKDEAGEYAAEALIRLRPTDPEVIAKITEASKLHRTSKIGLRILEALATPEPIDACVGRQVRATH